jgi:hypothetical protein
VRGSYVRVGLYENFLLEVELHSRHVKHKESRWGGAQRRQRRAVSSQIVLQAWLAKLVWNTGTGHHADCGMAMTSSSRL